MRGLPWRAVAQQRTQQRRQQQELRTDSVATKHQRCAAREQERQLLQQELRQARCGHVMRCELWMYRHMKQQAGHRAVSAEGDRGM